MRTYKVVKAKRSATYQAAYEYVENSHIDRVFDKGSGKNNPLSQEGFKYSLATGTHGGVQVRGEIRQEAMINLVALRTLTDDLNLRRYLLGLALVALSFRDQTTFNLREGCLLRAAGVGDFDGKWNSVEFDGTERAETITHQGAVAYALCATPPIYSYVDQLSQALSEMYGHFEFDKETAEAWLKIEKKKRKALAKKKHPAKAIADERAAALGRPGAASSPDLTPLNPVEQ